MSKELQELGKWKVGQKVLMQGGRGIGSESISAISKITDGRKGTIYVGDYRFDELGGQRGNDIWNKIYISIATEADYIRIRGKRASQRISQVKWLNLDPAKAILIEKLLNDNGIVTIPPKTT